jgi:tRNA uridine 5-carboxymethylaminomethyl modification enzyme
MRQASEHDVIVIGGGHAGAEAAWAASSCGMRVALVTMDPARIAQMSCNPAIGGLAKGQMVREIDALGGLMGLAIDATGIQFRMLNASKGPAVRGPRAQADKYAYAREIQRLLATRGNIDIIAGRVEQICVEAGRVVGIEYTPTQATDLRTAPRAVGQTHRTAPPCPAGQGVAPEQIVPPGSPTGATTMLRAGAVVLTTGTFMRGLLHTGEQTTEGGRIGEAAANAISRSLRELGFELGRLKTGTCPRLDANTIDYQALEEQPGDDPPIPFGELTPADRFPALEQRSCWITRTNEAIHEAVRANLHRAPMYNGQIDSTGPRYCPSFEAKIVRFADKPSHHVFLEPESLETDEVYLNGIPTSLPADVQDQIIANLPGCENARIIRYGYAVEYDMVWPHQIDATCMTKSVPGLLLAGQINGTSGYEEAAGQGLLAGLNAARYVCNEDPVRLGRDHAYIGVMMDDLVTKVPREPYRMFTSRAEHRLGLRADNAVERLTPMGRQWGLVDDVRWAAHEHRQREMARLREYLRGHRAEDGVTLWDWMGRSQVAEADVLARLNGDAAAWERRIITAVMSEAKYAGFIERHRKQHERVIQLEGREFPPGFDYAKVTGLRNEAKETLEHFRPGTLGQAGRLAGITPADLTLIAMTLERR